MKKVLILATLAALAGCQGNPTYTAQSENLPQLTVEFADSHWDGKRIPKDMICSLFGAKAPTTPELRVSGIPAGANAIIVEFNDLSYAPLAYDGGHGKIGFWIDSADNTLLPAVAAKESNLGNQIFVEKQARTSGRYSSSGYLPPCSGGKNNTYAADIKAVYKARSEGEENRLLAEGHIVLGKY